MSSGAGDDLKVCEEVYRELHSGATPEVPKNNEPRGGYLSSLTAAREQ